MGAGECVVMGLGWWSVYVVVEKGYEGDGGMRGSIRPPFSSDKIDELLEMGRCMLHLISVRFPTIATAVYTFLLE